MKFKEAEMKKIILLMSIIFSLNIIACGEDDGTKADLKWKNKASTVNDIRWVNDGRTDQIWEGEWNNNEETNYKGIESLSGTGECLSNGNPAEIVLDTSDYEGVITVSTNSATIAENAAATLSIVATAKK